VSALQILPGKMIWQMPGRFSIVSLLGPRYSLRCVLFHNISETSSPFTDGLRITMTPHHFEETIRFLAAHYSPISLETFLEAREGRSLPKRPVLVTFDDAYASIVERAVPICRRYGVPAIFFVTAAFVGNFDLALDNLVCFVANQQGFAPIQAAALDVVGQLCPQFPNLRSVAHDFVPQLSLEQRAQFKQALADRARIRPGELASQAKLYLTTAQLRALAGLGVEIGNHTYSHARCRVLQGTDLDQEIGQNQKLLERVTGRRVRAFSVPYGTKTDLTPEVVNYLRRSGHDAAFLVDSLPNNHSTDIYALYRVSLDSTSDADAFSKLEILPRLRAMRDTVIPRHNVVSAPLKHGGQV